MIEEFLGRYPGFFERMEVLITPEVAFRVFQQLADTYAPTLTARYTRGLTIQAILQEMKAVGSIRENIDLDLNFRRTGNVSISLGTKECKPIWAFAHLDNISYLTGPKVNSLYPLTAFHEPKISDGERDGIALGYDGASQTLKTIAEGTIITRNAGERSEFRTEVADLPLATRVVFQTAASWDRNTGLLYGSVDDAFGCAALVLSAVTLSDYDVNAIIMFTDEEEGVVSVGNSAFARGSRRVLSGTAPAELPAIISVTDIHDMIPEERRHGKVIDVPGCGSGALFAGFAGGTRGGVTPPNVLAAIRELAGFSTNRGIPLTENPSYISRSDCVSAMMATQNVVLIGFPGAYSHFDKTPRAHVDDLVTLSKSLCVLLAIAQSPGWRRKHLIE
ncbi:MAG: hypothetical protein CL877_08390 [Dehalococcoidales bacterium]|nr:hypothetical protein [Dehalococcoidales bacterium]